MNMPTNGQGRRNRARKATDEAEELAMNNMVPAGDDFAGVAGIVDRLAGKLKDVRLEALPDVIVAIDRATAPKGGESSAAELDLLGVRAVDLPCQGSKIDAVTRAIVAEALKRSGGNVSAAARLLGMERKALERKVAKYTRAAGLGS